ncbi:MAG: hypothetical protein KDB23_05930, partial [Planctomycetales bacterium]|nr:hypothetical protein [Planctomycetales bacterium]
MSWRRVLPVVLLAFAASASISYGQPIITDGLSIYYSFDSVDEDGIWADGSGNGLDGLTVLGDYDSNSDGLDDIRLDTEVKKVGSGSVWFDTLEQAGVDVNIKEDRIGICDPSADYIDNCDKAIDNDLIPVNGFTVAAWVMVEETGQDQALWQHRAEGGGFTHTQVQSNGNIRTTLRDDSGTNLVNVNDALYNGGPVEWGEWFHWAVTYSQPDPNDLGSWAVYVDGEVAAAGLGESIEELGGWGLNPQQGAMLGMVPDFNRQLAGHLDEFYLFTRGLDEDEIMAIYLGPPDGVPGDFDGDGELTAADIDLLGADIRSPSGESKYDVNGDGSVNGDDRDFWVVNLKNTYIGDADLNGVFDSGDFVKVFTAGEYEDGIAGNSGWAE